LYRDEHQLHCTSFFFGGILLLDYYTIWLFNIAMETGSFIDGLPIKNCDFL
jgi:hypothetical protein